MERCFPDDFLWGAATSAYQIEGSPVRHGGGPSVWDTFCTLPGRTWRGQDGYHACEHYELMDEDVKLMKEIGLRSYRFSISWPRVLPEGRGMVNHQGLDFYSRLVDRLLEAGIEPLVTLFHWDYPHELFLSGGWMNPDSPLWFRDYTATAVQALGDRVKKWITLNEPQCFVNGHGNGYHAPGLTLDAVSMVRLIHHVLLSHGRAVQAVRDAGDAETEVGFAPVGITAIPQDGTTEAREAAWRYMETIHDFEPEKLAWNNSLWMDPVLTGSYPKQYFDHYGRYLPDSFEDDLGVISEPTDFLGLNIYHGQQVDLQGNAVGEDATSRIGEPITACNWPVTPEALYWGPKYFFQRYNKPIYITENGISCRDFPDSNGVINDVQRITYTEDYLAQLARGIREGIPVKGYYHWSLMDNFEWSEGYRERFGLIYVDFKTRRRIIKESGRWYRSVISQRGAQITGKL